MIAAILVESIAVLIISIYFAVEPDFAWTRKHESLAFTYFWLSLGVYSLLTLEAILWACVELFNKDHSKLKGLISYTEEKAIAVPVMFSAAFIFLIRVIFSITFKQTLTNFYSTTLLSGGFQSGLSGQKMQNREQVTRVENRIEEAREQKGLSTVHETYNENNYTYMNSEIDNMMMERNASPKLRVNSVTKDGSRKLIGAGDSYNNPQSVQVMNTIFEEDNL